MRFAIVFAAVLAIAFADSVQGAPDGGAAGDTITIDAVIDGAEYSLDDILDGRVTGLSDHSINGVKSVALTNDGFLVGLPSYIQAVLIDILPGIAGGFAYTDSNKNAFNHILCITANWVNDCNILHMDGSLTLGSVVCDNNLNKPISSRFHRTADGVYVNLDYFNYLVCFIRQNLTTARTFLNTMLKNIPPLNCRAYYIEVVSGKAI